jgi:predicted aminopeptidase
MAMIHHARPIPEVLKDEKVPPRVRRLLGEIESVNAWGRTRGLRATKNYQHYVKIDRPAATWVVSACDPVEFRSKDWRFPIVGSVPYLGWFDLESAKEYATELRKEGWDVDVRGARAYSTLGWFRDPVVSSMIPDGEEAFGELVNVVLHESVHATLYVSGQTYFNESLASFIADRMTYQYMDEKIGAQAPERVAYAKAEADGNRRVKLLHEGYEALDGVYKSQRTREEKLAEKAKVLEKLRADLGMQRELNNASMIQYRAYNIGTAEFTALFKACGEDWGRFFSAVATLENGKAFEREHMEDLRPVLNPLTAAGCTAGT